MFKINGVDTEYETREDAKNGLIKIEDDGLNRIADLILIEIQGAEGMEKIQLQKAMDYIAECITTTAYDYQNGFDPLDEHYENAIREV